MTTPKEIIANRAAEHMPKPAHNMFAAEVIRALMDGGYVIVPKYPTDAMVGAVFCHHLGERRFLDTPPTKDNEVVNTDTSISIYCKMVDAF